MNHRAQRRVARVGLCTPVLFALLAITLGACKREPAPPTATPPTPPTPIAPAPLQSPSAATAIDARQNNVVPSSRDPAAPSQTAPASERTDLEVTNDVRRAIAGDPTLSPAAKQVGVTTSRGIVQLSGTLLSEADRENLRIAVLRVRGVISIDNRTNIRK